MLSVQFLFYHIMMDLLSEKETMYVILLNILVLMEVNSYTLKAPIYEYPPPLSL
jgi:hypothetical protein